MYWEGASLIVSHNNIDQGQKRYVRTALVLTIKELGTRLAGSMLDRLKYEQNRISNEWITATCSVPHCSFNSDEICSNTTCNRSLSDYGPPLAFFAAVLPCTHLRKCRFLSSGSARNPPADSAGTGRHWSSSFPLPNTALIVHGGRVPTIAKYAILEKNIRRQKIPARIQCSSNMASTAKSACAMDITAFCA